MDITEVVVIISRFILSNSFPELELLKYKNQFKPFHPDKIELRDKKDKISLNTILLTIRFFLQR
jgi:hypothetical protein